MKFRLQIFFLIVFCFSVGKAQTSLPNVYEATRATSEIKLDGIPDEKAWEDAPKVTNFTQRELNEGEPVTELTQCALIYTEDRMYVAAWCWDTEPSKIMAKHMKRDFPYWTDDNFEIIFDTFDDDQNGYVFVVNPNGARADVMTADDGQSFNIDWNGVWDAKAVVNAEGWFAEMVIPFSTLKFPDKEEQVWGVNFERNIRRKQEQVFWQGWSQNYDFEHVSHAGTLTGIRDVRGKDNLEFKPYALAGGEWSSEESPNSVYKIGGDVNYLVTPRLKMNLTINTDFAQVESDRAQVNLSRFSLYYPEKREFFLEGKNLFEFNFDGQEQVFYSRRIGIRGGDEIPIIGGLRTVGKAGRTNIGALSIQTAEKGETPTANYSVVRIEQDVFEKSSVGGIVTSKFQDGRLNAVIGLDAKYYTSSVFGGENLGFGVMAAQSFDDDRRNENNSAYKIYASYPNELINAGVSFSTIQAGFNPEVGFLRRKNYKKFSGDFNYRPRPKFAPWIRRMNFKPIGISLYYDDLTGALETANYNVRPFAFDTRSGESFDFTYSRNFDRLTEPFSIYDKQEIPIGEYSSDGVSAYFGTFAGRDFRFSTSVWTGEFYSGVRSGFSGSSTWSITKHVMISGDYSKNFLAFDQNEFSTDEIGGRLELAPTPKMNATFFGQWNNITEELLINFRYAWIPVIGSDFYLAVNQPIDVSGETDFNRLTILAKLIWRLSV